MFISQRLFISYITAMEFFVKKKRPVYTPEITAARLENTGA